MGTAAWVTQQQNVWTDCSRKPTQRGCSALPSRHLESGGLTRDMICPTARWAGLFDTACAISRISLSVARSEVLRATKQGNKNLYDFKPRTFFTIGRLSAYLIPDANCKEIRRLIFDSRPYPRPEIRACRSIDPDRPYRRRPSDNPRVDGTDGLVATNLIETSKGVDDAQSDQIIHEGTCQTL